MEVAGVGVGGGPLASDVVATLQDLELGEGRQW
jgi:hypothetical protein